MELPARGIFNRTEKKYIITQQQADELMPVLLRHMHGDKNGKSTVCSMYFDTPDMRVIRASIDAKAYKEKLRVRCYGVPTAQTRTFVELKKKYLGVVYKRRFEMTYGDAMAFLVNGEPGPDTQMGREVEYFLRFYPGIRPAIDIFCERLALFGNDDENLRVTFDSDLRYRMSRLDLSRGTDGEPIIPANKLIMEIKTSTSMPVWLTGAIDELHIYPQKFSKVATAFTNELEKRR
ncbi:MAG: polyphosphate polymerase domain-containing protein [Clostridiales bacterium]|nr:polyphosphate polymerase domain-containing protein [Clostridiales bacterium]